MQVKSADAIREEMARGAVDHIIDVLAKLPDEDLVNAVDRRIKIKVKLY